MYNIENIYWKASFDSKGAELRSLFHKPTSQELMWQADPTYWSKTSPVLFPIVGALKGNTYTYGGKYYTMSRHGFARDSTFEIQRHEDRLIEFVLRDDGDTFSIYPFAFDLKVLYGLSENGLTCTYQVNNYSDDSPIFFSLGGHPAFTIRVDDRIKYDDYRLIFPDDRLLSVHKLQDNLINMNSQKLPLEENRLALSYSLFYDDALIIKDLKSRAVILSNNQNEQQLSFAFQGFEYFGLWAAKNANFICLEPWAGIADCEYHDQQLVNKKGIVNLAPGNTWEARWQVDFVHTTNESRSFLKKI